MGHLRKASLATTASLLAMLMLAGCGGDDSDDDSSDASDEETTSQTTEATEATTSASASTSPSPTEPTEPMDTAGDITQEQVDAALLTAAEVSPELVEDTWTDESTAPPCDPNATPTDEQVPPQVEGGVSFETADSTAFMEEELSIYETDALAAEAFQLGSAGLDCSEGTFPDGSTLTIGAPTDVTADVNTSGVGTTTLWEVSGDGFEGALIVTLSSRVLLVTTFIATDGADTSGLPAPLEVAEAAFNKALAN